MIFDLTYIVGIALLQNAVILYYIIFIMLVDDFVLYYYTVARSIRKLSYVLVMRVCRKINYAYGIVKILNH